MVIIYFNIAFEMVSFVIYYLRRIKLERAKFLSIRFYEECESSSTTYMLYFKSKGVCRRFPKHGIYNCVIGLFVGYLGRSRRLLVFPDKTNAIIC